MTRGKTQKKKKLSRKGQGRRSVKGLWIGALSLLTIVVLLILIGSSPRLSKVGDHWHARYEIIICGERLPLLPYTQGNIHTHGDGQIHIHPKVESEAGANANLGRFFANAGLHFDQEMIRLPVAILFLAITVLATSLPAQAHAPQGEISPVVQELATLLRLLQEGKGSEALTKMQERGEIRRAAAQLDRTANLRLREALASRQRDRNVAAFRRDLRTMGFYLMLESFRQIERDLIQRKDKRDPLQAIFQQGRNIFILLFEAHLKEQDPPLHRQLELTLDLMDRRVAEGDHPGYSRLLKDFVEALADAYNIPPPR